MTTKTVRIGGAMGYWGEVPVATPQFLATRSVDYVVYDYLAEITMSILARARAADPQLGYATDFVTTVIKPNLADIAAQGVRIVSNAGGVNPAACAAQVRELVDSLQLDLKVAVIQGDDLFARREELLETAMKEMFSGEPMPPAESIASINAYLGAFPIARALDEGADIVITGRCVDSAVTLGICVHEFGWQPDDVNRLAAGSLAGHLLECGPQATGGNFTDWERLPGTLDDLGYPIAHVCEDGTLVLTKPDGTSGAVTTGTVAEQMLYEIGDPQAYLLPDVVCDFSQVTLHQIAPDRVRVANARGCSAPDTYKVSLTALDGFRGGQLVTFYGGNAEQKARAYGAAVLRLAGASLRAADAPDFTQTSIEILGAESQFGSARRIEKPREVVMKIAVRHPQAAGIGAFLKALAGLGLAAPPGMSGFAGARAKPTPLLKLYSFLIDKKKLPVTVELGDKTFHFADSPGHPFDPASIVRPADPPSVNVTGDEMAVPLVALAWGRSGDKGNNANVGIIARDPEYLPYVFAELSVARVTQRFAHFLDGTSTPRVERFLLPGCHAINFVLHDVLGGGGMASIRNDPQGKGYAQLLLEMPIPVPARIAKRLV